MTDHRVIEILKTFSRDDIISFNDYLSSPFFIKGEKLRQFYKILIKYHPDFDCKLLNEEKLYKKVNPELPFKKTTMNKLFFDLSNAAENYLKILNFQKKEIQADDFLRDELFSRKLDKLIGVNLKKVDSQLKEIKNLNGDYYFNKFRLATDMSNYIYINKLKTNRALILSDVDKQIERGRFLTYFFITEMMKAYDNLLTINKTFDIGKDHNFIFGLFQKLDFQEVLKFLIANSENTPYAKVFEIYLSLLTAFSKFEQTNYYYEYKKLLLKNLTLLGNDEIRFHFGRLIKYCMMKRETSKESGKFDYELFNIYKYILENEYYKSSVSDFLPVELFRNILLLGLRLKAYKWVIRFIKKFNKMLNKDSRKNIYYFSLSEYYFKRKMFKNALQNFHKIQFDDFIFKLDLKNLMLRTYFELKEYESALCQIDSYRHFLSADKTLSRTQRKRYKNFVNAVHKLILFKTSFDNDSKYNIEKELDNDFPFKDWVTEKYIDVETSVRKAV